MNRPSRPELLLKFFPEMGSRGSAGDREAAVRYNALACEAILADQLMLYDHGYERYGPGVLCVRLHQGASESCYLPVLDLSADMELARKHGDDSLHEFLSDAIDQIETCRASKAGLVMLVDNSTAQIFRLDRDQPAKEIKAMLEAL